MRFPLAAAFDSDTMVRESETAFTIHYTPTVCKYMLQTSLHVCLVATLEIEATDIHDLCFTALALHGQKRMCVQVEGGSSMFWC